MTNTIIIDDGTTLRVERDVQEVRSWGGEYEPDPEWAFVDERGHEHRMVDGSYPTLKEKSYTYFCEDCLDEHDEKFWACGRCNQEISPVRRLVRGSNDPRLFAGPERYFINDEPATREEFQTVVDAFVARRNKEMLVGAGKVVL